ncbi:MAG: PorT family protein [Bacteroidia bacterium]|nr:PorT family protein [Bacteroidia bacterium]
MVRLKSFLLAATLLMLLSPAVYAQIGEPRQNFSIGFNGGVNFNNATFQPKIKENTLMGPTFGLTARYISEKYFAMICGAQVELNFSQRGWDELFEMENADGQTVKDPSKSYTRQLNYIDVPFLAHLAFGKDQGFQFFINAGPQVSFLISEKESIKPSLSEWTMSDAQAALYNTKAQNKFDYGIAGGLGFELRTAKAGSFLIEGRYYFALSDFYKTTKRDYFSRAANSTLTAKITYLFDLKR